MKCVTCAHLDSKVVESRDIGDSSSIRRRRQCLGCGYRFTTYERVEVPYLMVTKKDGSQELFDRSKLLGGLHKAIQKRPVDTGQLEELVDDVERSVHECGETEIASSRVGEMVMERLMKLDEVAYVRFASVYRSFTDAANFEAELERLKASTSGTL
ncbi:transcriptional regulator NrdR [Candidatus Saccharibacteria bacterium QS_5_54_17]|nr:MAG: transcriptional regulator NrdR [Candidatus Saccharibacteria bacterium QS_5_54_17]